MPERRFPPPWTFDEANHACFIVRDGNRFPVAYVYFESEPGRRAAARLMTKDEARRIAAGIALPELLKPRDEKDPGATGCAGAMTTACGILRIFALATNQKFKTTISVPCPPGALDIGQ
jgi:hypothetical protein